MKNLIEIAQIVTKKRVKKLEIFDDYYLQNKSSKFNEFYEALVQDKFKNDRDAAAFLYGSTPKDDKYRQLKSRFRKRLLNTLFFLDVNRPSSSSYDRAYFSCNKDWTLVKILLSNQARTSAVGLAGQILTTSLKYKFADVIVNCSRILREYAAEEGDDKAFEEYDQYIKQYSNILEAEVRSEELFQRVSINYHKPPSKQEDITEEIDTYCKALNSLTEQYDSPVVRYNKYLVWTYRHEMQMEYKKMIDTIAEAQQYVDVNPDYYQSERVTHLYLKKLTAYLHLKDSRGLEHVEQSLEAFTKGNVNWYIFQEYYFLLAMHVEDYERASEIYNEVIGFPKFSKANSEIQDKWEIFNYYLNYAIDYLYQGKRNLRAEQTRSFKVKKLLAQKPLFPKDQRIYVVHLVIVQVLYLLEEERYSSARESILPMKSYINRQFRKEEYFRAINFLRLLQQLQKADFQINQLSNVDKYYKRITEEKPFAYHGKLMELEIIPFDNLWNLILQRLEK